MPRRLRERLRSTRGEALDRAAIRIGTVSSRIGARLLLVPHRAERIDLPEPLHVGEHRFDVLDDLVGYTGLSPDQVAAALRRHHESFRTEWHAFPAALREERWYYASSRTYLFANAVHVHDSPRILDVFTDALAPGAHILDYGGGSGNLALLLAAAGFDVHFLELSALQKDFVRFRLHRHELESRVRVLDGWVPLEPDAYDAVAAFDVFEHLADLRDRLEQGLLPALRRPGVLIESSPFVRNISNPMHHEDSVGFDAFLRERGFMLERAEPEARVWRTNGR